MKKTLKDKIRDKVLFEIATGNYSLDTVITERKLIDMFGVSKSPVREALIELCNEKVLESMPRYGYKVVPLNRKNIIDATEVRLLLEISALKKTFSNLDSNKIELLKEQNESHKNAIGSQDAWIYWDYNSEFHLLLISFADNQLQYEMLKKILGILPRAFAQYYLDRWKSVASDMDIERHTNIIKMLENRDCEGAVRELKEDVLFIKR